MKRWLLHIWMIGVLGMLAASCSQDADELALDTTSSGTIRIQFSLALDESRSGSRATWGTETGTTTPTGDRVVGTTYENKIDLSKLQVFLFQNGNYLGEVGGLSFVTETPATGVYTFRGEVTVNGVNVTTDANGNKTLANTTIMVTANYDEYVNGSVAVTYNYLFDYIANNYRPTADGTATNYIPMWGMQTANLVLYEEPEIAYNAVTIYMLRSMAKIEVELGGDVDDDYVIIGATLNKYNQKGYLLPAKYTSSSETAASYFNASSTSDFNTEACINTYSSTVTPTGGLAFNVVNEGKSCVIYVPEYEVGSGEPLSIGLTLSDGTNTLNKSFPHGHYIDGEFDAAWNVIRNHYYKYEVSIKNGVDLEIIITLNAWNNRDVTYDNVSLSGLKNSNEESNE